MKKILIILSALFVTFLNIKIDAAVIPKECKYLRTFSGDVRSSYNFNFSIKFTPLVILGKPSGYKIELVDAEEQFKGTYEKNGKNFTVEIYTEIGDSDVDYQNSYIKRNENGDYYMPECPPLFYDDDDDDPTKVMIYQKSVYGNFEKPLRQLQETSNDGTVITGDPENSTNKTTCTLQIANWEILENNKTELERITLYVNTYENGKIYIKCADCLSTGGYSSGGYLEKNANGENALEFLRKNSNTFNNRKFIIKNEDVDKIYQAYKYGLNPEDCPDLVLNAYFDDDEVVISTEEKDDADVSASATQNDTVDNDPNFFPHTQISDKPSTCTELLGGENSEIVKFIQNAWTIVKVSSIVLTIVLGIIDFLNATSKDKDVLMASVNKTIKRLIIVIIILLLPTVIDIIGEILGTSDILCGIE